MRVNGRSRARPDSGEAAKRREAVEKPAHIQKGRQGLIGKRYDVTLLPDGRVLTASGGLACGAENPRLVVDATRASHVRARLWKKSPRRSHSGWEQRPRQLYPLPAPPWSQFALPWPASGCQHPREHIGLFTNVYTHQPHGQPRRCLTHRVGNTTVAKMAQQLTSDSARATA
jgi:hypothetical protein